MPLIAALIALLCIGIVVGTIAVALIPVYLQQKGDDITVVTNSSKSAIRFCILKKSNFTLYFQIHKFTL